MIVSRSQLCKGQLGVHMPAGFAFSFLSFFFQQLQSVHVWVMREATDDTLAECQ